MIDVTDENLIFVISQPRAGSTLLQLMLSSHDDIATTSEPWIALHPLYALRERGINAEYDSVLARRTLKDFLEQSGVDEKYYKSQVSSFLFSLYENSMEYQGKSYFLDKTPRYYNIIPELQEIFPKAKFIILLRNPISVFNSILKTWVKENWGLLNRRFRDDLLTAPGKLLDGIKLLSDRCISIRYEDLVAEPELTVESICQFLDLPYSDKLLEYGCRADPEWRFGDKVGVHKDSRPNVESLNSWKDDLRTPQEKYLAYAYLKELGHDVIEEMGYDYNKMEACFASSDNNKKLIPWSVLMRNNASLMDQVELDLCLNPENLHGIINSYLRVHQRGAIAWLLRGAALSMKIIEKFGR